jgi:prepilin-type N-terminal cleavage/methylation domain-containing protein
MPRRGYTLIEMLVVITVSTVLLSVAVGVLHVLSRAERSGREHGNRATIVARLADQFRSDVHAALHPIPSEGADKNVWQFALPPPPGKPKPSLESRRDGTYLRDSRSRAWQTDGLCSARHQSEYLGRPPRPSRAA